MMQPWVREKAGWLTGRPRLLTVVLLIALVTLYSGWLTYVIAADRPLDFYVYYISAEIFAHGSSPYTISDPAWRALAADLGITNYAMPYRYPPHVAVFLILFRPLGPRGTMVLWVIANAAALIGGMWLLGRSPGAKWPALAALLFFVPPLTTLLSGQINGLLFLCLAVALWALECQHDGWLGISLALGTVLKVIPLALVLYLFWRKQWRAGLIAVGVILALTLSCIPVIGWQGLADYGQNAIARGGPEEVYTPPTSQTITATLGRLFPANPDVALAGGRWLGLLIIVLTALICWPAKDTRQWMPMEFGLIVVALQLIPPFTFYHQLVLLLIPFFLLARQALIMPSLRWMLIPLILGYVLTDLHGLIWHQLEPWPLLASTPFYTMLMLWGLLAWLIVREKVKRVAA